MNAVAWEQYWRLGVGRMGCYDRAWVLHSCMAPGRWEKELACNIKELQNSIGTCSSKRCFFASDHFHSSILLTRASDIPRFTSSRHM
jgi:hypothetical protein